MRVLVCGGRDMDASAVWNWLERNAACEVGAEITTIIHGGARGADRGAADWGKSEDGCRVVCYPANWHRDGRAAGPIRNQRMLDEGKPEAVIAFPGGRGTADMVRRAKAAGVRVIEVA